MKFGRDLATSVVPEWEEQYCDYNKLKKILKDISSEATPDKDEHTTFFLTVRDIDWLDAAWRLYRCK